MKKKINKKVPAYAFGINANILGNLENILGAAGTVANAAGGIVSANADATSSGAVAGSALSGLGKGAAMGSSLGSVIPGIGTAIGGAIGAVGGAIGGIFTGRKRRREAQERRRKQTTLNNTKMGLNNAAVAEEEYWDDNTLAYTFENGGILPDLAYVDNNEIIRDDYGNIIEVPNNKPGTDNHLIDASTLESVLSDKIKKPGTNKTFAKEGKRIAKMMKPSKGKDEFAKNTDRLNKINANKAYEQLLAEQEDVKAKKGIKPKVKGIPAYEDGFNYGEGDWTRRLSNIITNWLKSPSGTATAQKNSPYGRNYVTGDVDRDYYVHPLTPNPNTEVDELTYFGENLPNVDITATKPKKATPSTPKAKITTTTQQTTTTQPDLQPINIKLPNSILPEIPVPEINGPKGRLLDYYPQQRKGGDDKTGNATTGYSPDWLSLVPTVYNFAQSLKDPEYDPLVVNPYAGAVRSTMARRRMNIEPIRNANRRSRAISNYNLANINANTGANLAARTQAATNEYSANADMYATKQNTDNQYLADYANTLNNLGQQFVQSNVLQNENNARNRARARDFGATAASQLGKWSQVRRQERNQYNRDKMMLPYLQEYLDAVTNAAKYNKLTV